MTKADLEKENKRLREALEKILTLTMKENIESIIEENKLNKSNPYDKSAAYAVSIGQIEFHVNYALHGDDYLNHPEKYKKEANDDERRENRPA